ncbi:hypothetical protein OT_ostta01g04585 [Ostreococcus tauri]|uniref:Uncharacterized protein n=1 Tax=Ostreococcus tauri TaxID=70448 RepID=A0A090LY47_OSTTA|nr:hypothetical protein OT_ostta01g04585 [Ostreococcus tauri]CEF96790.1 hypothetical protein OT_ostta01g04585 [Ostreococcus tauri]|eukprot:XP_022838296.1 hypothetical protein OT_ostta01g04585 [Ostreococcus tauri]
MLAARASPAKTVTRVTFAASKRARAAAIVRATKKETNSSKDEDEAKIDFKGLKQLVSMGLGTISGDITEINLKDPKRTVVMELEANNFEDKDGNPLNFMNNDGFVGEKGEGTSWLNVAVPIILGGVSIAGIAATLKALM